MKNTDLHTHSYYSDGLMSPKELVRLAKKRKIKNIALTDHDSVNGVNEAIKEGKKVGVRIIPGVELRTDLSEILGYFIDIKNKKLLAEIKKGCKNNQDNTREWCNKLQKAGYKISFKEIWDKYPKARGNINSFYPIWVLHLKGYGPTMGLSKKLRKDRLEKEEVKDKPPIVKAIRIIREAGGVPVLAHAWLDPKTLEEKRFKKYVKAGLKGIEVNNGDRPPFLKMKIIKKIKKLAKKYRLIMTSGSDFHGPGIVKQMPGDHNLGHNNCDEKVINQLKEAIK
jgi:hypothetical protein